MFCRAGDDKRRAASYVIRTLIWQLTTLQPEFLDHLSLHLGVYYEKGELQLALDSQETWWGLFVTIVSDPRLLVTFCLFNGLDECDEDSQHWLADTLTEFSGENASNPQSNSLRTILVSRGTVSALRGTRVIRLDSDNHEKGNTDISSFVKAKVTKLVNRLELLPNADLVAIRTRVEDRLLARADNTFLWVGYAVVELMKKKTWTDVEKAIDTLPKGLPAFYERMLLQIEPQHREVSAVVLR